MGKFIQHSPFSSQRGEMEKDGVNKLTISVND